MSEFKGFPKLARLFRTITITEKLDGTNACVVVNELGTGEAFDPAAHEFTHEPIAISNIGELWLGVWAQSRKRLITPDNDNYGFARWVQEHADELVHLGEGYHFGEWWGQGIQRNYGLDEKRFSLFNTHKWDGDAVPPACCHVVPKLYVGEFDPFAVDNCMNDLSYTGSHAAPGFHDPEGIVLYHHHGRHSYKITFDDDHKGEQ